MMSGYLPDGTTGADVDRAIEDVDAPGWDEYDEGDWRYSQDVEAARDGFTRQAPALPGALVIDPPETDIPW